MNKLLIFNCLLAITLLSCKSGGGSSPGNSGNSGGSVTISQEISGYVSSQICRTISGKSGKTYKLAAEINGTTYEGNSVTTSGQSCIDLSSLAEGSYTIEYAALEGSSVVSGTESSKSITLDKTAPSLVSKSTFTTNWYTSNQTSEFTFSDSGSGFNTGDEVKNCTISTESSVATCSLDLTSVCDKAGNCLTGTENSESIKLDKTAPTLGSLNYSAARAGTTVVVDTVISLSPTDSVSGVAAGTHQCTMSTTSTDSSDTKNCTINVCDEAGNCTSSNTNHVVKRYELAQLTDATGVVQSATTDETLTHFAIYNGVYFTDLTGPGGVKRVYTLSGNTLTRLFESMGSNEPRNPTNFIVYKNSLYFSAQNAASRYKMYKWDGTTLTNPFETNLTSNNDSPLTPAILNNELYFPSMNTSSRYKMYKWDGTTLTQPFGVGGTTGNANSTDSINFMTIYDSKLYFIANSSTTYTRVHIWDGSSLSILGGTSGLIGNNTSNEVMNNMVVYDNKLFIAARISSVTMAMKLLQWDGTTLTQPLGSGTSGDLTTTDGIVSQSFISTPNGLYFKAVNNLNMLKIQKWNGSALSTVGGSGGFVGNPNDNDWIFSPFAYMGGNIYATGSLAGVINKLRVITPSDTYESPLGETGTRNDSGISDGIGTIFADTENVFFTSRNSDGYRRLFRYGLVYN